MDNQEKILLTVVLPVNIDLFQPLNQAIARYCRKKGITRKPEVRGIPIGGANGLQIFIPGVEQPKAETDAGS